MMRMVVALATLTFTGMAAGKDLLGVYQDALKYDPQIREADANRMASREANPQAWAALLPQLNGNYAWTRQKENADQFFVYPSPTGVGAPALFRQDSSEHISQHGYQIQLQQSIFSWSQFQTLAQAHKKVAQAETDYRAAEENLIQRVGQAYFNVLTAQANLDAQAAALDAFTRQLDQANRRFEVGLIAITDAKEAQAAHDSAAAAVIDAKRQLASQQQALREITNEDYPSLAKPGEDMPLQNPQPADPERWVSVSMDQNLSLVSSRLAADVARDQVRIAFGGHLPTVSLSALRTDQSQSIDESVAFGPATLPLPPPVGPVGFPGSAINNQVGIQINVPIFSGGGTQSQVRQAQYLWIAAKEHVTTISRQTEHAARDAYSGVISEVARVNALRQGLESAQVAMTATEAGYEVGTRTAVEVVQQRQTLVQAQTNYASSKYSYILDIIQLRLAAGTLDQKTLEEINGWLTQSEASPPAPTAQPPGGSPPIQPAPPPQPTPQVTQPTPQATQPAPVPPPAPPAR